MIEALELYFAWGIYQAMTSSLNVGHRELYLEIYFGDQLFISCLCII